jgi:hypothetical protein
MARERHKDMIAITHLRSKRHQSYVKQLRVRIGGADDVILAFHDWLAWALLCLIEAGEAGVAPLDWPAPLVIETVLEQHSGPYGSRRGRYVLRSLVEIIDREDAA